MQKVFARIQHFVVHTEKGEIKYDDDGKLVQSEDLGAISSGADALKKIWQQIKDQEANALSLKIFGATFCQIPIAVMRMQKCRKS